MTSLLRRRATPDGCGRLRGHRNSPRIGGEAIPVLDLDVSVARTPVREVSGPWLEGTGAG